MRSKNLSNMIQTIHMQVQVPNPSRQCTQRPSQTSRLLHNIMNQLFNRKNHQNKWVTYTVKRQLQLLQNRLLPFLTHHTRATHHQLPPTLQFLSTFTSNLRNKYKQSHTHHLLNIFTLNHQRNKSFMPHKLMSIKMVNQYHILTPSHPMSRKQTTFHTNISI